MSTVYQATDRLLHREVAIKVFTARADSEEDVERQEAEARLLASLNHHALTTLLDAGVDTGDRDHPQIFLVMEYIPGADLRHRLRGGPISPIQVCWLGFDLCEGVDYVHANGVLHRDIKPANVLLASRTADTRLRGKLTDFGVAALRGEDEAGEHVVGTAAYLSPEQAAGDPATPASDTYSLGLVLLEALTGVVAFPGGVVDSALARLDRDPAISVGVPEVIADVLRRMTASRPQDRISLTDAAAAFRNVIYDDHIVQRGRTDATQRGADAARLAVVHRFELLETSHDESFDHVTRLAARILNVPIALITLLDGDRALVKGHLCDDFAGVDRDAAFWSVNPHAEREPWTVADTLADPRTRTHRLVIDGPHVRSFASASLIAHDGGSVGSLSAMAEQPREFTGDELETLEDLAEVVTRSWSCCSPPGARCSRADPAARPSLDGQESPCRTRATRRTATIPNTTIAAIWSSRVPSLSAFDTSAVGHGTSEAGGSPRPSAGRHRQPSRVGRVGPVQCPARPRRPRSTRSMSHSKLSSMSVDHWKPPVDWMLANPWKTLRSARRAWVDRSGPMS
jgi:hypothetical protein